MKRSHSIFLLFPFLLTVQSFSHGQTPPAQAVPAASVPSNIHQLFIEDQADRTGQGVVPKYAPDVPSRDAMRRAEAKKLLAAGELKTAQDFHDAAFIFQHGSDPNDYLLAHILAMEAIVKGDEGSKWIAAATLDRYLQAIGQKQVFGTQYLSKSYMYFLEHKNDPAAMNRPEAQEKGTKQEPYDRMLIPDSLRGDFCVPYLAMQAVNLSELEAGRPMTGLAPPGCSR